MKLVRRLILILVSAWVLLALGTYLAGERTEVAVLTTYDADGTAHQTKMWIVDYEGHPYVRIGRPGRGWGERLRTNPKVELARGGEPEPKLAEIVTDQSARSAIDRAFADKYGWVDWWFGLVIRKNPEPVRLDPRAS